jgi:hypothetical protein
VALIGHRPRQIDQGTAAAVEDVGRLPCQVKISVTPRRADDRDVASAT